MISNTLTLFGAVDVLKLINKTFCDINSVGPAMKMEKGIQTAAHATRYVHQASRKDQIVDFQTSDSP